MFRAREREASTCWPTRHWPHLGQERRDTVAARLRWSLPVIAQQCRAFKQHVCFLNRPKRLELRDARTASSAQPATQLAALLNHLSAMQHRVAEERIVGEQRNAARPRVHLMCDSSLLLPPSIAITWPESEKACEQQHAAHSKSARANNCA